VSICRRRALFLREKGTFACTKIGLFEFWRYMIDYQPHTFEFWQKVLEFWHQILKKNTLLIERRGDGWVPSSWGHFSSSVWAKKSCAIPLASCPRVYVYIDIDIDIETKIYICT